MNNTYDVIGAGEGMAGLVASVLLAGKGFSCLWADTSEQEEGLPVQYNIPSLITRGFWEQGLKPILGSLDTSIIETLRPRKIRHMQSIVAGKRVDIPSGELLKNSSFHRKMQKRYLSLLARSMANPTTIMNAPIGMIPRMEPWEKEFISGLSRTTTMEYVSYLRYLTALIGMYSIDYGEMKHVLGSFLAETRGTYVCDRDVDYLSGGKDIDGVRVGGTTLKARYYLTEDLLASDAADGFVFYGKCELAEEVIPVGMGDLLVVSPPDDMDYPLILSVNRTSPTAMVTVVTRVRVDNTLTSLVEVFSWASGMILKRLRQIIPFMDEFLVSLDGVDPFSNNTIRPWFSYRDHARPPWFSANRRYIKPVGRIFACDRMKVAWFDVEGEILWGICVANAILKELNRSDLIIKTMV